ncbi:MAG: SDR family NAD(P)-dependent oxidoreductase, partial [Gemmatimonadetes bacterium]|nr:SDR family NAD(P)-dependent oxidoreductase [Gemmatimonadota bacterium]
MLTWQAAGGFSLDASVRISGSDHAGRERLLRYCARPPFALERFRRPAAPDTRPERRPLPLGVPARSGLRGLPPSAAPTAAPRCGSSPSSPIPSPRPVSSAISDFPPPHHRSPPPAPRPTSRPTTPILSSTSTRRLPSIPPSRKQPRTLTSIRLSAPSLILPRGPNLSRKSVWISYPAYCGAKHAIQGFTDSLRTELLHDGNHIRVTSVHLPAINTPQFR